MTLGVEAFPLLLSLFFHFLYRLLVHTVEKVLNKQIYLSVSLSISLALSVSRSLSLPLSVLDETGAVHSQWRWKKLGYSMSQMNPTMLRLF